MEEAKLREFVKENLFWIREPWHTVMDDHKIEMITEPVTIYGSAPTTDSEMIMRRFYR